MLVKRLLAPGLLALIALSLGCGEQAPVGEGCELLPGQLVISEFMAAPIGGDRNDEWFEVYNASPNPINLNRLVLGAAGSGDPRELVVRGAGTLQPGEYFVFGAGPEDLPHVDYSYGNTIDRSPFSLTNTNGVISVSCRGVLIDEVAYGSRGNVPSPVQGRSMSFDGGVEPNAILNKDAQWWCASGDMYDGVNIGTPGQRNVLCGFSVCYDGDTERDIVVPQPGDLVISEVLPRVSGPDTNKEWIELYVAAGHPVDINALTILAINSSGSGTTYSAHLDTNECITVQPGDYLVLGGSTDPEINGNAPVDYAVPGLDRHNGFFFNSGVQTVELWRAEDLIDSAIIPVPRNAGSNNEKEEAGISVMLDIGLMSSEENTVPEAFCDAIASQGDHYDGLGTPGAPNRLCGVLTCREGESIRKTVQPIAGEVIVNEVLASAPAPQNERQYLEVYVTTPVRVDLNGLRIVNWRGDSTKRTNLMADENCLSAELGDYFVIGRHADPAVNGGLQVDGVAPCGTNCFYSTGSLELELWMGDTLLDYAMLPESVSGRSTSLRPELQNAAANDSPGSYCIEQTRGVYEAQGSPGYANVCGPACLEHGVPRARVLPDTGDVIITEILSNLSGANACRQWIEVYATAPVDLNELRLVGGQFSNTLVDTHDCRRLAAHSYAVLGAPDAVNEPSPWPAGVEIFMDLRCTNTSALYAGSASGTPRYLSLWLGDVLIADTPNYAGIDTDKSFGLNTSTTTDFMLPPYLPNDVADWNDLNACALLVCEEIDEVENPVARAECEACEEWRAWRLAWRDVWCHGALPTPGFPNQCEP